MPRKLTEKQKKTIERMKKVRENYNNYLQDVLENKYNWVLDEIKTLSAIIENLKKQLDEYEKLMLKLEGAKIALEDILGKEQDAVWQTGLQKSEQNNSKTSI